jgi:hypothetical protein
VHTIFFSRWRACSGVRDGVVGAVVLGVLFASSIGDEAEEGSYRGSWADIFRY